MNNLIPLNLIPSQFMHDFFSYEYFKEKHYWISKAVKPEDTQNPESAKTTRKAKAMQAEKEGRREAEKTTEAAKQVAMTGATYSKSETEEDCVGKILKARTRVHSYSREAWMVLNTNEIPDFTLNPSLFHHSCMLKLVN